MRRLIAYNVEDVVHLKAIMEMAYDRLAEQVAGTLWDRKSTYAGVGALPKAPRVRKQAVRNASTTLVTQLLESSQISSPKIVGIDLTGSERRATGWAILQGSLAETKSIVTTEDLVRETLAAKPDIVSIDSPLSVPEGWDSAQKQLIDGAHQSIESAS